KGAKNDWFFARPKKKCFLKGKKVHFFEALRHFWSLIGVDMIPVSRREKFHFFYKKNNFIFLIKKL
ncbi:hypothetical protein, partial [Bosea sp. (in: a-proteobacteria)]|uniref:hypothetical protein n=1 Tax=Bosea sp. (in: a-proteobacteria) TaxID=1871050 RepID=UPI0027358BA9